MNADPAAFDDSAPAPPADIDWPLLERVPALLAAGDCSSATCRALLLQSQQELQQRFRDEEPVEALVRARSAFIDRLLVQLWHARLDDDLAGRLTLAAVGGYGRGELHPCSDVDLLVLTPGPLTGRIVSRSRSWWRSCGTSASRWATACAPSAIAPRKALPMSAS